jgi:DNA sulfur modification protein DndD
LTISISALNRILDLNKADLLREREALVNDQTLAVETARSRVEVATEVLSRFDEIDVRDLTRRHHNLGLQIENSISRLSEIEVQLHEQTTAIDKIRLSMKQMGFQPDPDVARAEAVSARLGSLFTRAAEAYRNEIKDRVEADASDIFREISSEPDYERLQINDQFGLAILDRSGRAVEGRSAGYEHLVALALISALQRNAPVQGPVVMDNPFLRLDESHTRNVVTALPEVSDQLILLTFPGEFDRTEAVAALGEHLAAEFHLKRVGHEETEIASGPHDD